MEDTTIIPTNTTITTRYIHGPKIDEPLTMIRNNKTYYYHADALGSITRMTDQNGNIAQTIKYDSFGNIKSISNPLLIQPYAYTGREYDIESGFYYLRNRYYDPKTGRFISKDPIGFGGGDVNLFRYVGNNAVNWIDPWGLSQAIFDPNTGTITIVDNNGNILGQFPAGNNTDSRSEGPIPPGTYPVGEPIPNTGSRSDRLPSQGPYFIPIYGIPGRSEIGIHGGRSGPQYPTMGCIRTGNQDITDIVDVYGRDPITGIIVRPRR